MAPGTYVGTIPIDLDRLAIDQTAGKITDSSLAHLQRSVNIERAHSRGVDVIRFAIAQCCMLARELAHRIDPSAVGYRAAGRCGGFGDGVRKWAIDLAGREMNETADMRVHCSIKCVEGTNDIDLQRLDRPLVII